MSGETLYLLFSTGSTQGKSWHYMYQKINDCDVKASTQPYYLGDVQHQSYILL